MSRWGWKADPEPEIGERVEAPLRLTPEEEEAAMRRVLGELDCPSLAVFLDVALILRGSGEELSDADMAQLEATLETLPDLEGLSAWIPRVPQENAHGLAAVG